MIARIATAAVYVEHQDEAVQFWTQQVGFEVVRSLPMGPGARWIEVCPTGAESCLVIYPKELMEDWAERRPSIVFECADIEQTYQEMARRGVAFPERPREMSWGKFAIFRDPDGNEFGLREGSPRG
jgi:predicted enzyme related to lactoylglutathione lyase